MKKHNHRKTIQKLLLATFTLLVLPSCDPDKIDEDALYTFKDFNVGQYLQKDPDQFSEFCALLDTTNLMGLLNSAGEFTCFAPTNEAMQRYYRRYSKTSMDQFSMDSLQMIAQDHIIYSWALRTADFNEGNLGQQSMSERFFKISFPSIDSIYVNETARIIEKDIRTHNGVVHVIDEVLDPVRDGLAEVISKDTTFSIFYEALFETGLVDSLLPVEDESYDPDKYRDLITTTREMNSWFYQVIPESRKFGFTVLMESNKTMARNGITGFESLKSYAKRIYDEVYPEDKDITNIKDRRNSLNRFVAYHLITKQLTYLKFIDAYDDEHMVKSSDMYEYIETMCPNTLMEVVKVRSQGGAKLINRNTETGTSLHILTSNYDKTAENGVYHEISDMLVYDMSTHNMLSGKRLRFDSASFFDELTNNNMRGRGMTNPNLRFQLPRGYVNRIKCTEQTVVGYLTPYDMYNNYEGDEIFLRASAGKFYDFTIETLPIPAGTYEVRFGYGANNNRGVAQLYFDGVPCGVPINLSTLADNPSIGYKIPHTEEDDYEGFQNDKMMRNRGYMKAPAIFRVVKTGWFEGENARFSQNLLRRILGIYTFRKAGTHKLGVRGLSSGEFMFDYLELVPTSCLENEDIY